MNFLVCKIVLIKEVGTHLFGVSISQSCIQHCLILHELATINNCRALKATSASRCPRLCCVKSWKEHLVHYWAVGRYPGLHQLWSMSTRHQTVPLQPTALRQTPNIRPPNHPSHTIAALSPYSYPPTQTFKMLRVALISSNGLPSTSSKSARIPGAINPRSCSP